MNTIGCLCHTQCKRMSAGASQQQCNFASENPVTSLPRNKLLPALCIAHVDRGIREEHEAAFLSRSVVVERYAGILRISSAESRALDLRFHLRQKLRASTSLSELFCGQSNGNGAGFEISIPSSRAQLFEAVIFKRSPFPLDCTRINSQKMAAARSF